MKKLLLLLVLGMVIGFNQSASAQEYKSAIGLRLGYPLSVSYKTFLNDKAALELMGGFRSWASYRSVNIGALYQIHNPIESVSGLSWYFGGGLQAAFYSWDSGYLADDAGKTSIGISGNIGLDYKFANTPINLSLDWIPTYWLTGYYDGFGSAIGGLAVRYTF
ncbi:MAG: hypothetical protein IPQ18_13970 [Saprospiraceae bacterium]|jgi:hypothetical protein|nr:hypothetical protein [Saprospiraceae bacterium]